MITLVSVLKSEAESDNKSVSNISGFLQSKTYDPRINVFYIISRIKDFYIIPGSD